MSLIGRLCRWVNGLLGMAQAVQAYQGWQFVCQVMRRGDGEVLASGILHESVSFTDTATK